MNHTTTKVKVTSNGTKRVITRSQKVHSGTPVEGTSYIPDPAIRRDGIEKEYVKVSWYNPELNKKDWERSEARKQYLLDQIKATRAEIRAIKVPMTCQHKDANTRLRPAPNMVRQALAALRNINTFVDQLFTIKSQGKMQLS